MSELPPPAPPEKKAKSFFHHAATISVWLIPVPFVIQFLAAPYFQSMERTPLGVIIRLGAAALIALSFCAEVGLGLIALCGIPKYGVKGILWKALVGVLLPMLLIAAAIPTVIHARELAGKTALQPARQQR